MEAVEEAGSRALRASVDGDAARPELRVHWLGRVPYREAWGLQKELAARRADDDIGDQLLLLEHDPVLTLGKYADETHVRAPAGELERQRIEVIRVERGGEVTYHGPGQLTAYPILKLSRRGLMLKPLVVALEGAMAETCAALGVEAGRREGHPGCWVAPDGDEPRKIGALGIRVERGVSYHGIALNVNPDLRHFELIDACGIPGVTSTSIAAELGRADERPSSAAVAAAAAHFAHALGRRLNAAIANAADLPSLAAA